MKKLLINFIRTYRFHLLCIGSILTISIFSCLSGYLLSTYPDEIYQFSSEINTFRKKLYLAYRYHYTAESRFPFIANYIDIAENKEALTKLFNEMNASGQKIPFDLYMIIFEPQSVFYTNDGDYIFVITKKVLRTLEKIHYTHQEVLDFCDKIRINKKQRILTCSNFNEAKTLLKYLNKL
jgi:hypothetical protein